MCDTVFAWHSLCVAREPTLLHAHEPRTTPRASHAADPRRLRKGPRAVAVHAAPQPRAVLARLRPARPRAGRRRVAAAARARQVLRDRVVEPRRVLLGPDGR